MKLARTIAALAFAAAVGGVGMTGVVNAQPAPQGRYCLQSSSGGTDSCGYMNRQQCRIDAQPMGGWCTMNRSVYYRAEPFGHGLVGGY